MDVVQTSLPSGIRVVTEHLPSVRSVALGFWFAVGSRDEADHEVGASHFLEHLLFKGTERRTAKAIAEELDAVGGEMNAFTSKEHTCFYARLLDRDLPVAVDVLGDMLVAATNTPDDVEAERQVVLEEISIHLDTPEDLVHADFAREVLGDHPLAIETLGTVESVTAMDRDTVHEYYRRHYRPGLLTVAAAGSLDHDAVVALVDRMVGDLGRPGGQPLVRIAPEPVGAGPVRLRHRPTEQVHAVLGGRGLDHRDDRRFALRVANVVLGGGMSSRLFQEVREERGLAYSTYSYASSYTDTGLYGAYAGTTPARVDEVLKVMRDQLDELAATLTVEEVERAKANLKGSLVLALEDTGSRMNRVGRMVCTDAELISVDETIQRIDAVDLEAVREVAEAVYLDGPRTLVLVGPFQPDDAVRFDAHLG